MTAQEKRNLKYSDISTWKFSAVSPYFNLLGRARTFFPAWHFIFSVTHNFFFLQQRQVLHLTHRPVINVQTDLDNKIPFEPSKVNTYLGFIPFFVKPFDMMIKRLGYKKAAPYIRQNLRALTKTYKSASSIYRFSMTTTDRPHYMEDAAFKAIHAADPHLLCVPSLHVSICAVTYAWYKGFFEKGVAAGLFSEEEADRRLAEIKAQAIAIIESVLFVKQHSVNCIPTALYMITAVFGDDFFSAEDAVFFIEELFKKSSEIDPATREEILDYFTSLYERNLLENSFNENWQDSIKNWLEDFAQKTGQTL